MKYFNIFSSAIVAFAFAFGAISCQNNNGPELKSSIKVSIDNTPIKDKLEKLEGSATKIQQLEDALTKITSTEEKVKAIETLIGEYKTTLDKLGGKDAEIEERLKNAEGLLTNLAMGGVDLGLTSGTRWAPMNLGARKETEFGGYYAWGELTPKTPNQGGKSGFTKESYKFWDGNKYTKYTKSDKKDKLDPADDAATQLLGEKWSIPTKEQFEELLRECDFKYERNYKGTTEHGFVVTNKKTPNGNHIFIPCGGFINLNTTTPSRNYLDAFLWTSSIFVNIKDTEAARFMYNNEKVAPGIEDPKGAGFLRPREAGLNIRPVFKENPAKAK